jgi:hypothetical protein
MSCQPGSKGLWTLASLISDVSDTTTVTPQTVDEGDTPFQRESCQDQAYVWCNACALGISDISLQLFFNLVWEGQGRR